MKRERILSVLLGLLLLFVCVVNTTYASTDFVVTFYTNMSKTNVHETQHVQLGGHPTVPQTNPADYEDGGFRYAFGGWYWIIDNALFEFSFTSDDCEIWSDTELFAGYTQYLAEGYEMIVKYEGGTVFITDTTTPVTEILKQYPGIISVYTQAKQEYQSGTGSDKPVSAIVDGDEQAFATLAEALDAADADATVRALADFTVNSAVTVAKDLIIDLGGFKVSGAEITVSASVRLDGTKDGSKLTNPIIVGNDGALIIQNGDYTGMTLTVQGGTVSITGGSFSFDPSAYVNAALYDVNVSNGIYTVSGHTHEYDTEQPVWAWKVEGGDTFAEVTYSCACGDAVTQRIKPSYRDSRGTRTYTAIDSYGNKATTTKKLVYTVSCDGVIQGTSYNWGDICTLTAETNRAWYVDQVSSTNKIADGTMTCAFAVTGNTAVLTGETAYTEPQAAVRATMISTESEFAAFNAKWSIPAEATVQSVQIFRGYTKTDRTISAETLIDKGTVYDIDLLVHNGDYTLNLLDLTPTYYQHAVIVLTYLLEGEQKTLVSTVQKTLPNGHFN